MLARVSLIAVLVAGCGRFGFDPSSTDAPGASDANDASGASDAAGGDPSLLIHIDFEGAVADVAQGRSLTCEGGCPVLETGRTSTAATFSGTQCLTIPTAADLHTQTFTVAVWFRATQARDMTMFGKPYRGEVTFENSWELFKTAAGDVSFASSGVTFTDIGMNANDQAWHHVAVTYSAGAVSTYYEGVLTRTASAATQFDVDAILVGCDRDTATYLGYVFGQLDEVRFYNRALSAAEIASLAQ